MKTQKKKQRGKPAAYDNINESVWKWFCMAREANVPISGPMIQEEAIEIAKQLNVVEFRASNGWHEKWKSRHNIGQFSVAGESGDVSDEVVGSWSERLPEIVVGFELKNVFNCDETGFFWKTLPDKTLNQKNARCKGGKKAKRRLTALFFVSALGEKLDPIIIEKSEKPRCFRNLRQASRPYGAITTAIPRLG